LLAYELERDPVLAKSFFSNMINFSYGGASLSRDVWDRIQRVAQLTVGERIAFCSGLSSTETAGGGTYCSWGTDDIGNIGVPKPGVEIKLVPLDSQDGRYEMRLRGRHTFAGYLNRPDLTKAAFDEEGFFKLGDAVRFADPEDPGCGLHFAGRVVEDFKLANGTWVRTGTIRLQLLDTCSPLLTDAVICGHDRDFVAALAWPNLAACRELDPVLVPLDANALAKHPIVLSALREKLNSQAATASARVERVILLSDPPSADANEIADKGYINQAAVRSRRAPLIEEVYQLDPPSYVVSAGKSMKSRL
jgi:feruloyl-CoA synthase